MWRNLAVVRTVRPVVDVVGTIADDGIRSSSRPVLQLPEVEAYIMTHGDGSSYLLVAAR